MAPLLHRSTMEEMLESIKSRDERPKDIPPALPQRPTSKARLPSAVRKKISAPVVNQNTEAPAQSPHVTRISVCEPRVSLCAGVQQTIMLEPIALEKDQNKSSHIQGAWTNIGGQSTLDGAQADHANAKREMFMVHIPNGITSELNTVSRTKVEAIERPKMDAKKLDRTIARQSLGKHVLPTQGQVKSEKTAYLQADQCEKTNKEETELTLNEQVDLEIRGIKDDLDDKIVFTKSQSQSTFESPYSGILQNSLERELPENNSGMGFPTVHVDKMNIDWEDDGISGLKKVLVCLNPNYIRCPL
eukprot:Gb_07079 [translate_table: standard]